MCSPASHCYLARAAAAATKALGRDSVCKTRVKSSYMQEGKSEKLRTRDGLPVAGVRHDEACLANSDLGLGQKAKGGGCFARKVAGKRRL